MKKYRVTGVAHVEIVTLVEANSEEEAEQIVQDFEVNICIHGSEYMDKYVPSNEFVLIDGTYTHIDNFDVNEN